MNLNKVKGVMVTAAGQTFSCDFDFSNAVFDDAPSPIPVPVPAPNPGSLPPPPVPTIGDVLWNPLTEQLWPVGRQLYAVDAVGIAIQFEVTAKQASDYPNGIYMNLLDQTAQIPMKDMVISKIPHDYADFEPKGGTSCTNTGSINVSFTTALTRGDCVLAPGVYFLNVRLQNQSGTAQFQVSVSGRG